MNRALKVAKWQLYDSRKAITTFYAVIIGVLVLLQLINLLYFGETQGSSSSGLDFNEVIFCFVFGLAYFSTTFKFTQTNNISRRSLFIAGLISFTIIAVTLAVTSNLLRVILQQLMPYQGLVTQLYREQPLLSSFVWNFGLNTFAIFLGWLITMIYYRCNRIQKLLVSFTPALFIIGLVYFNSRTNGRVGSAILRFIANALGFADFLNPKPLIAVGSFLIAAAICAALSFLLIRRATIRS